MSDTPRTDREVYKVSKHDIGFEVVNPALCRQLERELTVAQRALHVALALHQLRKAGKEYQQTLGIASHYPPAAEEPN